MNKITRAKLNSVIKRYNNHHLIGPSQQLELVIQTINFRETKQTHYRLRNKSNLKWDYQWVLSTHEIIKYLTMNLKLLKLIEHKQ